MSSLIEHEQDIDPYRSLFVELLEDLLPLDRFGFPTSDSNPPHAQLYGPRDKTTRYANQVTSTSNHKPYRISKGEKISTYSSSILFTVRAMKNTLVLTISSYAPKLHAQRNWYIHGRKNLAAILIRHASKLYDFRPHQDMRSWILSVVS